MEYRGNLDGPLGFQREHHVKMAGCSNVDFSPTHWGFRRGYLMGIYIYIYNGHVSGHIMGSVKTLGHIYIYNLIAIDGVLRVNRHSSG